MAISNTQRAAASASSWGDRIAKAGFYASILFIVFVLGSLGAYQDWSVSRMVRDAVSAANALAAQHGLAGDECPRYLWFPATTDAKGLVQRNPQRSEDGYTLYTSGDAAQAVLLDDEGQEVQRWSAPFSRVWPNPAHVSGWTPDRAIYIRRAHAFPNGDLLALYESPLQTPNGCGLAKLDRESKVIWTYDANTHHDFSLGDDGTIYTLTHTVRSEPLPEWDHLLYPVVEEFVTVLSPEGKHIKSLSLFEMLGRSPYHVPLLSHADQLGDVLHSNTVHVIDDSFAKHHAEINAGDLMICLRNLSLVIVVRLQEEKIVWATSGPWRMPHDPDPLDNGNLLIFDNCFARGASQGSRVVEYNPRDGSLVWEYAGSEGSPLRSDIRSCQQRLPGGNVLVTESDRGRLLEVTREGEIVWEIVHPVRGGEDESLIPVVSGGRRYARGELPFLEAQQ